MEQKTVQRDEGLVGRHLLLARLAELLRNGMSVVLTGPSGIGKTAMLRALCQPCRRIAGTLLYCRDASSLRSTLRSLAEAFRSSAEGPQDDPSQVGGSLSKLTLAQLRKLVLPRLVSGPYIVLLDHPGEVHGSYTAFLDDLAERFRLRLVVATRSLVQADTGRLWWVTWNFQRIAVPPLSSIAASRLTEVLLGKHDIALPDRKAFVLQAVRCSGGNPGLLTDLCRMAQESKYRIGGRINVRLMLLDRACEGLCQEQTTRVSATNGGML